MSLQRITFSGENLDPVEIALYQKDLEQSLRNYYSNRSQGFELRFDHYSIMEIASELELRLQEVDRSGIFSLLAAIEAAFRVDYLQRVYARKKDQFSRACRSLYNQKGTRASLEDDILGLWLSYSNVAPRVIADLRGAFKFRHWIAHGRYWTPKFGRRYDFDGVYILAEAVFNNFPMSGK